MEPSGSALQVDECLLGASLHIDVRVDEAWVEYRPGADRSGILNAAQRARAYGFELIPEDEDPDVLEFLPGGVVRHWMVQVAEQDEEEAAA